MSFETTPSSDITYVSYSFVLSWTLRGKEFKSLSRDIKNPEVIRSDLYQFKNDPELRFFLELGWSRYCEKFNISIKGSKMWSFELAYAFLVIKEKAFTLKASPQLSFLTPCSRRIFSDEDNVPIHCVVIADPVHPAPSAEQDDVCLMEDQNIINIEGRSDITLPEDYSSEMVINFIRRGKVPDIDVKKAIQIIRETSEHKCEILKIICVEYLMRNITAESVREISRAAIDYQLPVLERTCMEKIANGYIKTVTK
ncbi:unnamed protein product [Larinioides sclopetarius]|uniref:BTB/POZ domain-containing protein n=1 Tax=Larinioides sclopetarius TaxID=280406 RepID=A0AAV2AKL1_9ARAC